MAAIMIDYATLCRAIEDWKAGRAPGATPAYAAPSRTPARPAEEEAVEEYAEVDEASEPVAPQGEQQDSTVIYALPDYETEGEEVEVADDER
jgi:hypothetical protein